MALFSFLRKALFYRIFIKINSLFLRNSMEIRDKIIVIAYATYNEEELKNYKPTVVLVDDKNNIELITNDLVGGNYV